MERDVFEQPLKDWRKQLHLASIEKADNVHRVASHRVGAADVLRTGSNHWVSGRTQAVASSHNSRLGHAEQSRHPSIDKKRVVEQNESFHVLQHAKVRQGRQIRVVEHIYEASHSADAAETVPQGGLLGDERNVRDKQVPCDDGALARLVQSKRIEISHREGLAQHATVAAH